MLSNHLILCHHLLLLPSIFPSFRQVTETNSSHLHRDFVKKMCRYYILYKKDDTAKHQERTGTTKWKDSRTKVTLLSLGRKQNTDRSKTPQFQVPTLSQAAAFRKEPLSQIPLSCSWSSHIVFLISLQVHYTSLNVVTKVQSKFHGHKNKNALLFTYKA